MFLHTGTIEDLSDVAKIAHAKGKEVFRTNEDIRVLPICQPLHPVVDGYLLVVEKIGSHKQPLVGKNMG